LPSAADVTEVLPSVFGSDPDLTTAGTKPTSVVRAGVFTPALTTVTDVTDRRCGGVSGGGGGKLGPTRGDAPAHCTSTPAGTTVTDVTDRRCGGGKYPRSYNRLLAAVAVVRHDPI